MAEHLIECPSCAHPLGVLSSGLAIRRHCPCGGVVHGSATEDVVRLLVVTDRDYNLVMADVVRDLGCCLKGPECQTCQSHTRVLTGILFRLRWEARSHHLLDTEVRKAELYRTSAAHKAAVVRAREEAEAILEGTTPLGRALKLRNFIRGLPLGEADDMTSGGYHPTAGEAVCSAVELGLVEYRGLAGLRASVRAVHLTTVGRDVMDLIQKQDYQTALDFVPQW